jgi:hypothetical protein
MTHRLALVVALVALASCGSDGDGGLPTLSTPPPPVTIPLNGSYDLVVVPAPACGLPAAPYVLPVDVVSFASAGGTELRANLPGGGDALALDMLYPVPGRLQGSFSTRADVPLTETTWLGLRSSGSGVVSLAGDGRAEVRDGTMAGEVIYYPDEIASFPCTSADHSWSLVAR